MQCKKIDLKISVLLSMNKESICKYMGGNWFNKKKNTKNEQKELAL